MSRSRKRLLIIGVVVVVVLLVVIGNLKRDSEKTVKVQIASVSKGSITSTVRAPGKVRPEKEVQISAGVPGEIMRLAVREGDRVEQGQLLLELDKTEYLAHVQQGKAAVESARSNLRLAGATLEQARSSYDRRKVLFDRNLTSKEELEAAKAQLDVREAEAEAAEQRVSEAAAALNIAQDNLRKTTFHAPQAGVVSELNVEAGEIVVIGTMNIPGTVIMTVADLAHMQVECDVDETDVVNVALGQKGKIFVDAFPDTVIEATVVEIGSSGRRASGGVESSTTDFEVKLTLDSALNGLKPGMTADAEIETATHSDVLKIPIQAVVVKDKKTVDKWVDKREGKETAGKKPKEKGKEKPGAAKRKSDAAAKTDSLKAEKAVTKGKDDKSVKDEAEEITGVFVVEGEVARFIPVKTGIMSETDVEIVSGLTEKSRVVTGPFRVLRELKDGARVKEEKKEEGKGKKKNESE
ncbi:MAG: efflux RND transporter periplasmic adaptor subunit [Candidatus Eisenbacteria bacterium]